MATPSKLVDIGRLSELSYVRDGGDHLAIGALTRHRKLETDPLVLEHAPVLARVAGQVGDPQVRHRGTIGGSIAHGDAASDLPAAVLALGGTMVVQGPSGTRQIGAADFHRGFLETALGPDELLIEVRVPKHTMGGFGFQKFNRRAQDWAIVGVVAVRSPYGAGAAPGNAAGLGAAASGSATGLGATAPGNATGAGAGVAGAAGVGPVGIALVNMGSVPVRASAVESALAAGASVAEAAEHAADGLDPPSDLNASPAFRAHLARVLVRRALEEAGA
jgi:carbon-monoxide dehydrogenase medium subunit